MNTDTSAKIGPVSRLLVISLAAIAVFILLLALAIAWVSLTYDNDDYRLALTRLVHWSTGDLLQIDGDFSLSPGGETRLTAGDIHYQSADGAYAADIGRLDVGIALRPLFDKQLLVRQFVLSRAIIEVHESTATDTGAQADSPGGQLALPVIDNLRFDDVHLDYYRLDDPKPITLQLDALSLDDVRPGDPLKLDASGTLESMTFRLAGESGDLPTLLAGTDPYPLAFTLDLGKSSLQVKGIVAEPLTGGGLDVTLTSRVPALDHVLALYHIDAPPLGQLDASLQLHGDLVKPSISDIHIQLQRESVDVLLSGTVEDPVDVRGIALSLSSNIQSAELLRWLAPAPAPRLQALTLSTTIKGSREAIRLEGVDLNTRGEQGLSAVVTGMVALHANETPVLQHIDAGIDARVDSSRVFSGLVPDLPIIAPLELKAQVTGSGSLLELKAIDLTAGSAADVSLKATGQLALQQLETSPALHSGSLNLSTRAKSSTAIGKLAGIDLPAIAPVRASAKAELGKDRLVLTNLQARAGNTSSLNLAATGQLRIDRLTSEPVLGKTELALEAKAGSTAQLSSLAGTEIPDLGKLQAQAALSNSDGSLGLEDILLTIDRAGEMSLRASGVFDNLEGSDEIDLKLDVTASNLASLGRPFHVELPDEGIVKLALGFSGQTERLALKGDIALARTRIDTQLSTDLSGARPAIKGHINVPVLHVGDFGLHPPETTAKPSPASTANGKSSTPLLNDAPIDLSALGKLDLDLSLKVDEIVGTQRLYDKASAHVLLQNGRLEIKPLDVVFDGGHVKGSALVNAREDIPVMSVGITSDDLAVGPLMEQKDGTATPLRGQLTTQIELQSRGRTTAELAANLNGRIDAISENAKVKEAHLELLTKDVFGWTLSKLSVTDRMVNVDCGLIRLGIKAGVLTTDTFLIDAPGGTIRTDATVDLARETLDITIYPDQKRRFAWNTAKPIRVTGTFSNPVVKATSLREISESATQAALLAPVIISTDVLGGLTRWIREPDQKPGACDKYLEGSQATPD